MITEAPPQKETQEVRDVCVPPVALTLDEFLRLYEGRDEHFELVKGVPTKRMAARYDHEELLNWLLTVMLMYASKRSLGKVYGSRSAVRISDRDGRLPDLLFIRADRLKLIQAMVMPEAPDVVVELMSKWDSPGHRVELESDYKLIGVPEIIFIDAHRGHVDVFRKSKSVYEKTTYTEGRLRLESVPGFWLDVAWLLSEKRPLPHEALELIEG